MTPIHKMGSDLSNFFIRINSNKLLGLILYFFINYSFALTAGEYMRNGLICIDSGEGIEQRSTCRNPTVTNKQKSTVNKTINNNINYNDIIPNNVINNNPNHYQLKSCNFSLFSSWPDEVDRLKRSLNASISLRNDSYKELAFSLQDIEKSQYLSSETIRNANENVSFQQSMIADYNRDISKLQWCLRCARLKLNGQNDCEQ